MFRTITSFLYTLICTLGFAVALSACGDDEDTGPGRPAPEKTSGSEIKGVKSELQRMPLEQLPRRIYISDAVDPKITIIDLGNRETVAEYAPRTPAWLCEAGARYVLAVETDANLVSIFDNQVYADGDSGDGLSGDPVMRSGNLDGPAPTHCASDHARVAMFYEANGSAASVGLNELPLDEFEPVRVETGLAHQGFATPFGDYLLASLPAPGAPAHTLPSGVAIFNRSGEKVASFEKCEFMSGEATIGGQRIFGCADGLMVLERNAGGYWVDRKIPYPAAVKPGDRVYNLRPGPRANVVAGGIGDNQLMMYDLATAKIELVELPAGVWAAWFDAQSDHGLAVLTEDGKIHVINAKTSQIVGSVQAVAPFARSAYYRDPVPMVTMDGGRVYVSDPQNGRVVVVDTVAMEVTGGLNIGGHPAHMAILGVE